MLRQNRLLHAFSFFFFLPFYLFLHVIKLKSLEKIQNFVGV